MGRAATRPARSSAGAGTGAVYSSDPRPHSRGAPLARTALCASPARVAEHALAVMFTPADHAGVGHGGGVGCRLRAGEAETGDLAPVGQARQPRVALRRRCRSGSAERLRSQGVGTMAVTAVATERVRELADHLGQWAKAETPRPPYFFGNDQPGKSPRAFRKVPGLRRQIAQLPGDLPFIDHVAEGFHRSRRGRLVPSSDSRAGGSDSSTFLSSRRGASLVRRMRSPVPRPYRRRRARRSPYGMLA